MGGRGGRVEGFLGSEKWAQLAAPVIPSQSPVGLRPLPSHYPKPFVYCAVIINVRAPGGKLGQSGSAAMMETFVTIHHKSDGNSKQRFHVSRVSTGASGEKTSRPPPPLPPRARAGLEADVLNEFTSALKI